MPVLAFDRVTKRFGEATAVEGLSFTVEAGETFGFLGLELAAPGRVFEPACCAAASRRGCSPSSV